ncbi:hypothetical protein F2Q70_00045174, partial [Brassica cretica]
PEIFGDVRPPFQEAMDTSLRVPYFSVQSQHPPYCGNQEQESVVISAQCSQGHQQAGNISFHVVSKFLCYNGGGMRLGALVGIWENWARKMAKTKKMGRRRTMAAARRGRESFLIRLNWGFLDKLDILPLVIDFTAKWCGPCKSLEPKVEELAAKYTNVELVKIDVFFSSSFFC